MTTGEDVVRVARSWVGVPFLHQGRNRNGIDCVGLIIAVGQELGVLPPNFERRDYGRVPSRKELEQKLGLYCERAEAPAPGTVIGIRWNRELAHTAFCTGPTLIHAWEKRGLVVEHGYRGKWLAITDSVWRLPGVTYE
jgi:cell wall-associated NlpC family hydrolase